MSFKTERHNNSSLFVINHRFCELSKDSIRENSSIIPHSITKNFCEVECIHRQLSGTDMIIKEFKRFCQGVWATYYSCLPSILQQTRKLVMIDWIWIRCIFQRATHSTEKSKFHLG